MDTNDIISRPIYKSFACVCGKTHTVENLQGLRESLYDAHTEIHRLRNVLKQVQTEVMPLGDTWNLIQATIYGESI